MDGVVQIQGFRNPARPLQTVVLACIELFEEIDARAQLLKSRAQNFGEVAPQADHRRSSGRLPHGNGFAIIQGLVLGVEFVQLPQAVVRVEGHREEWQLSQRISQGAPSLSLPATQTLPDPVGALLAHLSVRKGLQQGLPNLLLDGVKQLL